MFRKLTLTVATAAMVAAMPISNASASDGREAAFALGALGALAVGAALLSSSSPGYAEPAPVYVQPEPVYAQPDPYYAAPQPVYVQPAPVYYVQAPRTYYGGGYRHSRW